VSPANIPAAISVKAAAFIPVISQGPVQSNSGGVDLPGLPPAGPRDRLLEKLGLPPALPAPIIIPAPVVEEPELIPEATTNDTQGPLVTVPDEIVPEQVDIPEENTDEIEQPQEQLLQQIDSTEENTGVIDQPLEQLSVQPEISIQPNSRALTSLPNIQTIQLTTGDGDLTDGTIREFTASKSGDTASRSNTAELLPVEVAAIVISILVLISILAAALIGRIRRKAYKKPLATGDKKRAVSSR
jgi:hypothetical protein